MALFITPRDSIDCNQLVSLLQNHANIHGEYGCKVFRVGQKAVVWENIPSYSPNVGDALDAYLDNQVLSVNELARQLKLWQLN